MKKVILTLIFIFSGYGMYKAINFLWQNGYYGGLKEGYVALEMIICLVIFIISGIFLYRENKK